MLLHGQFLQQRGQPRADFVGQLYYLKMLWKLRGTSVMEDLGEVVIGTVKVTRECIGDVVLPTREPLGILLDAG